MERPPNQRRVRHFNSKELALTSVLTSLWIVSQLYLGQFIGQITQVHGVTQRMLGWFLMLALAELTRRFGRVTTMAAIASLATRIIRPGRLYSIFVGFGYALGGLTFDILYFFPPWKLGRKGWSAYLLVIALVSGAVSFVPYLAFQFSMLGFHGFLVWIPYYFFSMVRSSALTVLGTVIGISVIPQIAVWRSRFDEGTLQTQEDYNE